MLKKLLWALIPFKSMVKSTTKNVGDSLDRLGALAKRMPKAPPRDYQPKAETFAEACRRQSIDKIKLQEIEQSYLKEKRLWLSIFSVFLCLSTIRLAQGDWIDLFGTVILAGLMVVLSFRASFRLEQVRQRELFGVHEFFQRGGVGKIFDFELRG